MLANFEQYVDIFLIFLP